MNCDKDTNRVFSILPTRNATTLKILGDVLVRQSNGSVYLEATSLETYVTVRVAEYGDDRPNMVAFLDAKNLRRSFQAAVSTGGFRWGIGPAHHNLASRFLSGVEDIVSGLAFFGGTENEEHPEPTMVVSGTCEPLDGRDERRYAEWPKKFERPFTSLGSVDHTAFTNALQFALTATSTDADGRPTISSVYAYVGDTGELRLIGSDGFQAMRAIVSPRLVYLQDGLKQVLPRRPVETLLNALKLPARFLADKVTISHNKERNLVRFDCGAVSVMMVLLDVTYPKTESLIDNALKGAADGTLPYLPYSELTVNRAAIRPALALVRSGNTQRNSVTRVIVEIEGEKGSDRAVLVSATYNNEVSVVASFPCVVTGVDPEGGRIMVDHKFLHRLFAGLPNTAATMVWKSPMHPMVVHAETDDVAFSSVIMQMKFR